MVRTWSKKVRFRDRFCVLCEAVVPAGQEAAEKDYRGRVICLCDQCFELVKPRLVMSEL